MILLLVARSASAKAQEAPVTGGIREVRLKADNSA